MALIICPECGREISDKAAFCIHCGYPLDDLANFKYKSLVLSRYDQGKRIELMEVLSKIGVPFEQACNCLNFIPATILNGLTEEECAEIGALFEDCGAQIRTAPDYHNREHNTVWQDIKSGKDTDAGAFDSARAENELRRKIPRCPRCGSEQLEVVNKFGYSLVLGWHGSSDETVTVCKACGHRY